MAMVLRSLKMPNEMWDRLLSISKKTNVSISEHIRRAVELYFQYLENAKGYTIIREEQVRYEFTPPQQSETLDQAGSLDEPTKKPGS